jgi:lipopolysaccharide export system permease protein
LTNPLYPIAFVFLIIAFVGQAQSTRSSRTESLVITFVVAATCRLSGLAVINAIVRHPAMVPVAYALPISMIVVSLIALRRSETQRPGRGRVGKAVDSLAALWVMLLQRFGYGAAERAAT